MLHNFDQALAIAYRRKGLSNRDLARRAKKKGQDYHLIHWKAKDLRHISTEAWGYTLLWWEIQWW